jgi:poly(A) polymerase
MNMALDMGLVGAILPPLLPIKGLFQGTPMQPEGDLWDHTMLVLDLLPAAPSFVLALAALLHDIGKPTTRVFTPDGSDFPNHERAGASVADALCRSLKLSNADREGITWLVAYHDTLKEPRSLRASKLKKILAEPGIDDLLALHRAIALASSGNAQNVDYCRHYLRVQPAGPINPPPLITGHDLVRRGLKPGSRFAIILQDLRDAQLDGQIKTKREALEWVERQLESTEGCRGDDRDLE